MANSSQHFSQYLSASKLLECSTLISYLKSLSKDVLTELYDHPATCLAVFRELPILAQQFVMRLLYVEQPVPKAVIISWVNAAYCGTQAST
jgi:transcription initiation factor TFIIH subunit 4